jgi:hypothetical protein
VPDNALVGVWRLVSHEAHGDDGVVHHSYGPNPHGYLIYDSSGYMAVAFMSRERPSPPPGWLGEWDTEHQAAAAAGFQSYAGTYHVYPGRVIHHAEVSLDTGRAGKDQVRQVEMSGNRLTLTAPPRIINGFEWTYRVTWERVTPVGDEK